MRILLADDQSEVRSALRLLLEQHPGEWSVAGEAADARALLTQVKAACPDLVLLDWEFPGLPAPAELITSLRVLCPWLKIVVLSGRLEARQPALDTGADAFVSKTDPPEILLTRLRALGAGGVK